MNRLFVGIELPDALKERLAGICIGVPGAKWVKPENLHLTLRFIGEVDEGRFGDIDAALSAVRAPEFELTLSGIGHFASGKAPRVLWVGVERNEPVVYLQGRVEAACARAGLESERRKFSPHITLARLNNPPASRLGAFLSGNSLFKSAPFSVEEFTLFSSFLARGGAIHRAEADYRLGAP